MIKKGFMLYLVLVCPNLIGQQKLTNTYVDKSTLVASQLGYKPESPKTVSLIPDKEQLKFKDEINYYIYTIGSRRFRDIKKPAGWIDNNYNYPYDLDKGKYSKEDKNIGAKAVFEGKLKRIESRWGVFWQGDFTAFQTEGIYQIECEYGFSTPFIISKNPYEKFIRGYLNYLYCQRSGMEIPGVRPVENLDDAVLDKDGSYIAAAGGWNDAGDYRKWISQTSSHIEALSLIAKYAHPAYKHQAIEEIKWGNKFFQSMINNEGRVYEDIGSGELRSGSDYDKDWWCENHAGCLASGTSKTDNIIMSGDERKIRTNYNPLCQYIFIRNQAIASTVLEPADAVKCLSLAQNAWSYGQKTKNDGRTLFLSEELIAGCELVTAGSKVVTTSRLIELVNLLIQRQEIKNPVLNGYYYEKNQTDAYRAVAWNAEPPFALLRFCELGLPVPETAMARESVARYIENYLLKDAVSNPFNVTPYGAFINPLHAREVTFRAAGPDRFVRTFINPLNGQEMVHGTDAVLMQHAYLMARAGKDFGNRNYEGGAERLIQWATGHNTAGLCLFTSVGFRHPVIASFVNYRIPDAAVNGFIGRWDDSPYIETSNAVEWNTQEVWGVPHYYAIDAAIYLGM